MKHSLKPNSEYVPHSKLSIRIASAKPKPDEPDYDIKRQNYVKLLKFFNETVKLLQGVFNVVICDYTAFFDKLWTHLCQGDDTTNMTEAFQRKMEQFLKQHVYDHIEKIGQNITCDVCAATNFEGLRFKCRTCTDYNLCENCFKTDKISFNHLATHSVDCIKASTITGQSTIDYEDCPAYKELQMPFKQLERNFLDITNRAANKVMIDQELEQLEQEIQTNIHSTLVDFTTKLDLLESKITENRPKKDDVDFDEKRVLYKKHLVQTNIVLTHFKRTSNTVFEKVLVLVTDLVRWITKKVVDIAKRISQFFENIYKYLKSTNEEC
ncbi:unnamed protein product [Didymodactylos carnosus]|uniref:ZZ-type domain-containing protein n=1 Tax=Didymodactylos carnosus TaxID=1234261 RepID=A0A814GPA0_9BILA|nr:unnamed protein product [Didymodactylos carnosus]CAF1305988.1 unnamed protein product [Didymodactylos carnosus]CAF3770666.1 unnamed protein product [Didymodactylos carnosus]CAF4113079.1 unnamed protein product [Didymodactylos carnosus]